MNKLTRCAASLVGLLGMALVSGCVHSPPSDPWDPIEPVNRVVYQFNQKADHYLLRPVAVGYNKVTPTRVQHSVSNFFANAKEPVTMVNSLLQLKWGSFNIALGRFMINSSAGIGGLFDVASAIGIANPDEDLGQTLGYWGLGAGPYLVLPFLGPSDGRDLIGSVGDHYLNPLNDLNQIDEIKDNASYLPYLLDALQVINLRASLLGFDQTLAQQFDPYAFVRGYYLENRLEAVYDGHVPASRKMSDQIQQNNGPPVSGVP